MATIGAISALQLQLLFMMDALDDGYDENGSYKEQVEEIQLAILNCYCSKRQIVQGRAISGLDTRNLLPMLDLSLLLSLTVL